VKAALKSCFSRCRQYDLCVSDELTEFQAVLKLSSVMQRGGPTQRHFTMLSQFPLKASFAAPHIQLLLSVALSCLCVAFSALTLLVGWQEGHPVCKN